VIESEKLKEFELIESRSIRYKGIGEKHEIERHADGTVTRKAKRYTGKKE
jgi:hypothetical protein